jgi:hypothetical protein
VRSFAAGKRPVPRTSIDLDNLDRAAVCNYASSRASRRRVRDVAIATFLVEPQSRTVDSGRQHCAP